MSSFDPRIVLRPRTLDETCDLALAYSRHHWRDGLQVGGVLWAGALLYLAALRLGLGLGWGPIWAIALILCGVIERIVTAFAGSHMFGNAPTLGDSVKAVASTPITTLAGATLVPLPFIGALATELQDESWLAVAMLCAWFWPLVLAQSIYVGHSVVLEKKPIRAAVKRGAALIRRRHGRALGFVMLAGTIRVAALLSVELGASFLIGFVLQLGRPIDELLIDGGSWPALAGFLAAAPLVALARVFDYLDARTRTEGWDIQVLFSRLAADQRKPGSKRAA